MARRLLIIEDERDLGDILKEILADHFEEIDYCWDPLDALEKIANHEYRLIMSDVMMPKLLGDDLVRKVRSQGNMTPIIFLTGHADKKMVLAAMRLGVADLIEKPFDPKILTESIERVLEIEKRREDLWRARKDSGSAAADVSRKEKMLGLLHVANEKKNAV